jgi:hypothetical protein
MKQGMQQGMRQAMTQLMLLVLWMLCAPVLAQQAERPLRMDGCLDRQGRPLVAVLDENLAAVAQYRIDSGQQLIRYNPQALPALLPESRLFIFAHECGRQFLGFAPDGERTAAQARQADCWAVDTLRHSGVFKDAARIQAVEQDLVANAADWTLLPGPARTLDLVRCSSPPSQRGSLLMPASAGSAKWDACVQACGARLYSCGRAASCQATFDQCIAACKP